MSMKQIFLLFVALLFSLPLFSQANSIFETATSISASGSAPDESALLDIQSTEKGILIPRMNLSQRDLIVNPTQGLLVYLTDNNQFSFWDGTEWQIVGHDDLGDHLASQTLNLDGQDITNANTVIANSFVGDGSGLTNVPGDVDFLRTDGQPATNINDNIYTNGNIGVGTNGPSFPLDIQGMHGERIRTYALDNYFAGLLAKNNSREFFIGIQGGWETNDLTSGFHIYDNTAGQRRFVIDEDGDVGIGASNPNAKLHINGDFRLVDGSEGSGKVLTSDINGFGSWQTLVDNVNDADADPTNESITSAILNGTDLEITETGNLTTVDMSGLLDEDWSYSSGSGNTGAVHHLGTVSTGINSPTVNGATYRFLSDRQTDDAASIMGLNETSSGILGLWDDSFPDLDLPQVQSAGVFGYCPDVNNTNRAAIYGYTGNSEGDAYAGIFQSVGTNAQNNYGIYVNAANSTNENYVGYFEGEKSYFEGKIGIANLSPATALDVSGTILAGAQSATMNNPSPNGNEGIIMPGLDSDYIVSVQDGNGRVQHKWNASYGTNETFLVGGEDAFFIDLTGNVLSDNSPWIEFKFADGELATEGSAISWDTQMIINQMGEVGINETSPDDRLHVTDGGNGTRVRSENSGNGWAGFLSKNTIGEIFMGLQGSFDANPGEFHIYDNVAGARRMVIDDSGNIGIGINNPSVKLDVNGSVNCTGGTCSSDQRWKKDIQTLTNTLDNIEKLRGVSYQWRKEEFPNRNFNNKPQLGLIAQEVEKVYPELIMVDNEGFKSMDYMSFTAVLLEAVKELKSQNEDLNKQVEFLKENNDVLESKISEIGQMKAQLDNLEKLIENTQSNN